MMFEQELRAQGAAGRECTGAPRYCIVHVGFNDHMAGSFLIAAAAAVGNQHRISRTGHGCTCMGSSQTRKHATSTSVEYINTVWYTFVKLRIRAKRPRCEAIEISLEVGAVHTFKVK